MCLIAIWLALATTGCATAPPAVPSASAGQPYLLDPSFAGAIDVYSGSDGAELGYVYYAAPRPRAALVYLHGIESHSGWFAQAAGLLRDRGYDVYCLDRRGSGINRENRGFVSGHVDDFSILLADIAAFVRPLRGRYEALYLLGLSWGGKLAMSYALTYPDDIEGAVLITPGLKALVDVSALDKLKIVLGTVLRPRTPIKTPIEPVMFTTTPRYLDYIHADPLRLHYASARFFWESSRADKDIERRMANNRRPVLLLLAGRDRIIDNEGVVRLLQQGAESSVEVITYPEQTHSIQFDAPERMVRDIDNWLARQRERG